jgi:uncharacterized membrane protein YbhN (UPF0104 family)
MGDAVPAADAAADGARPGVRPGVRRARRAVSLAVTVGFMGLVGLVAYTRRDELSGLFDDPDGALVLVVVLIVAGHFLNSAEFWVLYRAQGLRIGLWETWTLFLATQFGNLLPGQAGSLYRFRYLKVVHGFDYGLSGSNYGANLAITLASSALTASIGIAASAAAGVSVSPFLVAAAVLLGAGSVALLFVRLPALPRLPGPAGRVWTQFRSGWEAIRQQRGVAGVVLVLDVAKYLLVAWRFQIAFGLLDVDEAYPYFLVIAPAAGLAGAIAFTPGGFGVREAFITGAAVGMGTALDTGLLAATVDRAAMLLTSLVLGSIGLVLTRRRMAVPAPTPAPTPESAAAGVRRPGEASSSSGLAAGPPALRSQPRG